MKPVSEEKLFHTLDEILETKEKELEKSIVLKSNIGVHKILLSRLMYVEAQGRKVIYYLNNGEEITVPTVLLLFANSPCNRKLSSSPIVLFW